MEQHPLKILVSGWVNKIRLAMDYKRSKFQDDADTCMNFFNGPYDFMYGLKFRGARSAFMFAGEEDMPRPSFAMTANKVAEMVQIFGPVLYHRNPVRQVNPRQSPTIPIELFGNPADPNAQLAYYGTLQQMAQGKGIDLARAKLLEAYQNYTPTALDLKTESRKAIDEAIIKGMGLLWTELYTPRGGGGARLVGSFYDTVDNLLIDPDMESICDALWCARRCVHPVWKVEQEYGLKPGSLKGNLESYGQQSLVQAEPSGNYLRQQGYTNDLLVYWKIYSKMGLGARMSGIKQDQREMWDRFGDFCYLVIAEEIDWPINLPVEIMGSDQEIAQRIQWPTPYWADDAWPFSYLAFHEVPRHVWPMSHLKPGLGELMFLNWVYSFLAGKIKTASRDFIAIAKGLGEEIKQNIMVGSDFTLLEIEKQYGTISEVVQFLQHPPFNGDIWKVLEAVNDQFEKRVGLTELMYGQTVSQLRSASEAQLKSDQLHVRPDDMANKVEDWMGQVARQEALAARWHLQPQDVQPVLGPIGAYWWQQLLLPSDPSEILHSLEYRIEAGSAKKPNRERDAQNMQTAMTNIMPLLMNYAGSHNDWRPVNNLLADWARSLQIDPSRYLLQPEVPIPQPPSMGPGGPGAPAPGPGMGPPAGPPGGPTGMGPMGPGRPMGPGAPAPGMQPMGGRP